MTDYAHPALPFRDNFSAALGWLLRQEASHTAMTEGLYRQTAIPLRTLAQGVLLQQGEGSYLLSAESSTALTLLTAAIPGVPNRLLLHQEWGLPMLQGRYPGLRFSSLQLWKYPRLELPRFTLPFEVWPLDRGDLPQALRCDPTLPVELLGQQIDRLQVFGACIEDRLAGLIGIAPGGDMTWLAVQPELRGQGIARGLLLWMLRRELQSSHVPYLLLQKDHAALAPLLGSLGLERAENPLWLGEFS